MWVQLWSGHLGSSVSALVDGQLSAEATERAWSHVLGCTACRALVEREGWVKRQLAQMSSDGRSWAALGAWLDVDAIERKGRGRRRVGLAVVGAGSVSAAVFGMVTLGAPSMSIGDSTPGPATSWTRTTPASQQATPVSTPVPSRMRTLGGNPVRDIVLLEGR